MSDLVECAVEGLEVSLKRAETQLKNLSGKVDQIETALSTWSLSVHSLLEGVTEVKLNYLRLEEEIKNTTPSDKQFISDLHQIQETSAQLLASLSK